MDVLKIIDVILLDARTPLILLGVILWKQSKSVKVG